MASDNLTNLIDRYKDIAWFSLAGTPHSEYVVVNDAVEAFDKPELKMFELWNSKSRELEEQAYTVIGDSEIEQIFTKVAAEIGKQVQTGMQRYFDRREIKTENMEMNADLGLWPEILDVVLRDLAWAAVEAVIEKPGFFSKLITVYSAGRWPCGWQGEYPVGRLVVL